MNRLQTRLYFSSPDCFLYYGNLEAVLICCIDRGDGQIVSQRVSFWCGKNQERPFLCFAARTNADSFAMSLDTTPCKGTVSKSRSPLWRTVNEWVSHPVKRKFRIDFCRINHRKRCLWQLRNDINLQSLASFVFMMESAIKTHRTLPWKVFDEINRVHFSHIVKSYWTFDLVTCAITLQNS